MDVDKLMVCLNIPDNVQEKINNYSEDVEQQRDECVYYWRNISPYSIIGWGFLGERLQCLGQEAALRAANEYIQRAPGTCGYGMCMYWNVEAAYYDHDTANSCLQ